MTPRAEVFYLNRPTTSWARSGRGTPTDNPVTDSYDPATMEPAYYREAGMFNYGAPTGSTGFAPTSVSTSESNRIAGIKPGVTRSNYSGSIVWTNGPLNLSNLNLTGAAVTSCRGGTGSSGGIKGTGHKLTNIYNAGETYYPNTGTGGWFHTADASCEGIVFEHITVRPQEPNDRLDGFYGHDYTAYRCLVEGTVDAFSAVNVHAPDLNVELTGVWGGHLSWYDNDRSHTDGTHNDWMQHHGSSGLLIDGFTMWGYKLNALNPTNVAGAGNGHIIARSGGTSKPYIGQGFLQQTEGGGKYHVGGTIIRNGWIYGTSTTFKLTSNCNIAVSTSHPDHRPGYNTKLTNVTWMNDDVNPSATTLKYYPLRIDNMTVFNDIPAGTYPSGDSVATLTPTAWNLKWGTGSSSDLKYNVETSIRGTPVKIRSDSF